MTLTTTLLVIALFAAILGLSIWRQKRGYVPGQPPLIPDGLVQFLAVFAILLLLGHVITLVTGKPHMGRFG